MYETDKIVRTTALVSQSHAFKCTRTRPDTLTSQGKIYIPQPIRLRQYRKHQPWHALCTRAHPNRILPHFLVQFKIYLQTLCRHTKGNSCYTPYEVVCFSIRHHNNRNSSLDTLLCICEKKYLKSKHVNNRNAKMA